MWGKHTHIWHSSVRGLVVAVVGFGMCVWYKEVCIKHHHPTVGLNVCGVC